VERRIKDVGNAKWPMLTRTNYGAWAAMMHVMPKARRLWDAVNVYDADGEDDQIALEAICKAVPTEMVETMANKSSARLLGTHQDGEPRRREGARGEGDYVAQGV
jgi:hypothetical protein